MSTVTEILCEMAEKKQMSPAEWLERNLPNTDRYKIISHCSKYEVPESSVALWDDSPVGADSGYVTTASANVRQDMCVDGGAAYMSLASVLLRKLENGRTLLEAIQQDDENSQNEILALGIDYAALREAVLSIQHGKPDGKTDGALRQVYFPIKDDTYHLLTLLPPSSLMVALSERIDADNSAKYASRDEKSEHYQAPYEEYLDLAKVNFGGSQPQNISSNNRKQGMYVLPSMPPTLMGKKIKHPYHNFFGETTNRYVQKERLTNLQKLIQADWNNLAIREKIQTIICDIASDACLLANRLYEQPAGWSDGSKLPEAQLIWLDSKYCQEKGDNKDWPKSVGKDFARWLLESYKKQFGTSARLLGDVELQAVAEGMQELLREEVREAQ